MHELIYSYQINILILQVMEERLEISWRLADNSRRGNEINVNWVQFAAAEGKADYLQLLLNHG